MLENFEQEQKPKTREELEREQTEKEVKAVDRIVRGVNDIFIKEYKFEDAGVAFTVKIKAPNALEIGKIQARMSMYLSGMNNYASEYFIVAYQALATLREVGVDVPKELAKDEDIYNLDVLYMIGRDFKQWLDNFRF